MEPDPVNSEWIRAAKARGLGDVLSVALDVLEPLGLLGAQVLWVLQPALGIFGMREAVGDLAEALEEPGGVERLRQQLDEPGVSEALSDD
jgi:hypothetical protein